MSTKTVSNLLAPAGYPQWLAALTPQCGVRTASLLCLGLSRFEPSNEQPPSLPAFACLPAALPAAPRRLVCPRPALPFSSLCFSRCRAAAAPAAHCPACAATRPKARYDRDDASAPRSGGGDQAEPFGAYGGTPPQPPPRRTSKSQPAPRGGALRKRPPTPCTAPFVATC